MATNFKSDAKKSRAWFKKFTCRALEILGFKNVHSVESHDSELTKLLDYAGVDALAQKDGATMTIASRIIQKTPTGNDYSCFSIRDSRTSGTKTEFEKLKGAIEINSLRPMWHCQTFISEDKKSAIVSLIRTRQLVSFIKNHESKFKITNDGTRFKLADWKDLISAGVHIDLIKVGADGKTKKITA